MQMALEEHETIRNHQDIRHAYEQAVGAMEDLYQLIGRKVT